MVTFKPVDLFVGTEPASSWATTTPRALGAACVVAEKSLSRTAIAALSRYAMTRHVNTTRSRLVGFS